MGKLIERQVITTWYKPDERVPEEGVFVVVTLSGKGPNITYDHTLKIAEYWDDEGWVIDSLDADTTEFVVHAWCDLEPYGGGA